MFFNLCVLPDLEKLVRSLMRKTVNEFNMPVWQCVQCSKVYSSGQSTNLRDHIESHHIDGLQFPCDQCPHVARSSKRLSNHMKTHKASDMVFHASMLWVVAPKPSSHFVKINHSIWSSEYSSCICINMGGSVKNFVLTLVSVQRSSI